MSDTFYVRIRGDVKGPLSRELIVSQIRKKRLGRHHELSEDAVTWQRAGDFPGLFESNIPERDPEPEAPLRRQDSTSSSPAQPFQRSDDPDNNWHYTKGRNNLGPVTVSELRAMLATGRLLGSDRVWNHTMEDWVPVGDLPQFMGSIRDEMRTEKREAVPRATFFEAMMGTSQGAQLPETSIYKFPNITRYMLIAESVCRILFVLLLIALIGSYMMTVIEAIAIDGNAVRNKGMTIVFVIIGGGVGVFLGGFVIWLVFISALATLELMRVLIKIEDNTSSGVRDQN